MRSRIHRNRGIRHIHRNRRNSRNRHNHAMPNLSGRWLGRYKLIRRIDRGGFSDVYLALHVLLKKHVIVKVSTQEQDEQHAFLTEARIIAHVKHPHIIGVVDYNHYKGRPYIVTEYAEKGSLRALLQGNLPVPLPVVLGIVQPVADALDFFHAQGYVHQDVKLSNIFLDAYDNVLLGDFGLAAPVGETPSSTTFFATPSHAAPERIVKGYTSSPSVDVYALGVTLYQLLTGHLPFEGDNGYVMFQHLKVEPTPLRSYVPDLPVEVEQVVLKSLSKRPEDRFASAGELINALREAYEQDNDTGTLRSTGYPDSDQDEVTPPDRNENALDTAFALESYLFLSTIPAMLAYISGMKMNSVWLTFSLSVLCIPTLASLVRPNRLAKILVLLALLASSLIGYVAQNLLLTGIIQYAALACCTFFLFLSALF